MKRRSDCKELFFLLNKWLLAIYNVTPLASDSGAISRKHLPRLFLSNFLIYFFRYLWDSCVFFCTACLFFYSQPFAFAHRRKYLHTWRTSSQVRADFLSILLSQYFLHFYRYLLSFFLKTLVQVNVSLSRHKLCNKNLYSICIVADRR